jgi:hypothetical protein
MTSAKGRFVSTSGAATSYESFESEVSYTAAAPGEDPIPGRCSSTRCSSAEVCSSSPRSRSRRAHRRRKDPQGVGNVGPVFEARNGRENGRVFIADEAEDSRVDDAVREDVVLKERYDRDNLKLTCDGETNTCQLTCDSNVQCPGGFACFDASGDGNSYCVNQTCTLN